MGFTSKEIILALLSIIGSAILALMLKDFGFSQLRDPIILVLSVALVIGAIIFIIYRRINEINDDLENQKNKHKVLLEKFKTLEELNTIRVDIMELKREVFNNG